MQGAIVVELVSRALGATRNDVREFLDTASEKLAAVRHDLTRRVDTIIAGRGSDSDRADALIEYSNDATDSLRPDAIRLVAGMAGTAWGGLILSAGLNASGAAAIAGLGISVAPIVAILLGLVVMIVCGRYTLNLIRELVGRIKAYSEPY